MAHPTMTIGTPETTLTGTEKRSFDILVDAISRSRDYTLWGTENDTVVFDDPRNIGLDSNKTVRLTAEIVDTEAIKPGDYLRTCSRNAARPDPEEIKWVNDEHTEMIGVSGARESKYELIDGEWYRTEYSPDNEWTGRDQLESPTPVGFIEVTDQTVTELGVGDDQYEYR